MDNIMEQMARLIAELNRRIRNYELTTKQFQVACESDDRKKMEELRIAAHECLDQLLDIHQEAAKLKERQTKEVLRILRGKTK